MVLKSELMITFGEKQGGNDWEWLEEGFLGADKVLYLELSVDFMDINTLL